MAELVSVLEYAQQMRKLLSRFELRSHIHAHATRHYTYK